MLRRLSYLRQSVEHSPGKSWVTSLMQSFEQNEEMYRVSQSLPSPKDIDSAETTPTAVPSRQSDSRFERLTFMKKLLIGAPQLVGYRRAWDMYTDIKKGGQEYIDRLYGKDFRAPHFEDFDEFRAVHRAAVSIIKREEERAKAPKRRKAAAENEGYSEPVVEPALEHWRFQSQNSMKSLVEDKWKADYYTSMCYKIASSLTPDEAPIDSDDFVHVLKRAAEKYLRDESRPVLTNELSDYYNPYMMKKATTERLLHEGCVRNKLEETLVNDVIQSDPSLTRLRSLAELPPEVLEPLQAFRGVTNWSFDPAVRMSQKLKGIERLLDLIESGKPIDLSNLQNDDQEVKLSSGRVTHRFRNHVGFRSVVPRGRRGGWGHGKPLSDVDKDLETVRYPTLQRVAHSLPSDPHYRSQAVHAIQVLERSRGWTFEDKTKAVNALKEVLDTLPSSKMLVGKLDKAIPVVRYGRFAPGTLSSSHKFVRRKPSNLLRRNRIRMYFRSMTAITPLSKRWAERRTKNQARSKKKDSKR